MYLVGGVTSLAGQNPLTQAKFQSAPRYGVGGTESREDQLECAFPWEHQSSDAQNPRGVSFGCQETKQAMKLRRADRKLAHA